MDNESEINKFCKCGCSLKPNTKNGFYRGHYNKIKPTFSGRKHSNASKEKMSLAKKGKKGNPHTIESRKKISEFLTGRKRPEISGENHVNWIQDREEYKIRKNMYKKMRRMIHRVLEQAETKKPWKTYDLGYTPKQLKEHIESLWEYGMSWENYGTGQGKWQIDHIKPVSSFESNSSPKDVNSLSNLQPLWWIDNMKKFNHYES